MNDLIIPKQFDDVFPSMAEGLKRAWEIMQGIQSFDDIERIFLLGAGLSPHTYRNYLTAVKQLYEFTGGLNPLQITPAWIESFYDHLVKKVDRNTAYLRIIGLRKFFRGIRNVIPFYTSPFEIMEKDLERKLSRTKKGNRTKKALLKGELLCLLSWLRKDQTVKGLENYAIVLTLITSGLRAFELCQLMWKNLDFADGKYTIKFIGKGDTDASQELYPPAVEAARVYFKAHFKREPNPNSEDHFFHELVKDGPLRKRALWVRVRDIGKAVRDAGIIKRELEFSPMLFRRSFASLLFKNGMDLKALSEATRHADIETLAKHYVDSQESTSPYFTKILGGD